MYYNVQYVNSFCFNLFLLQLYLIKILVDFVLNINPGTYFANVL